MAIVVQYTTNVGVEAYDEVVTNIRFHDDLPDGLVVHTAAVTGDGRMRIFDVWQSREAYEHFDEDRLRPAIVELLGQAYADHGFDLEVHDLHSLVSPVEPSSFGPLGAAHQ
jgi:hypothetical protein